MPAAHVGLKTDLQSEPRTRNYKDTTLSKIRILPENLANQIAAGEVIERPASVVKELIENAVDAGSSRISVQIEGGGTSLIRVIDDGEGMDQDDILLCLERHATSKITRVEQLDAITSLGFRGEAIPSIASVSRMTITSRPREAGLGSQADIRFGKITRMHEMGCQKGTVITVQDLFGNVPARKKFLKTRQTELSHIDEAVRNAALASPGTAFTYSVNGRRLWSVQPASANEAERVKQLIGALDVAALVPVQTVDSPDADITVSGYLLPPDIHYSRALRLRIFVNGRAIRDRTVAHAVAEGLSGFLMKGRQAAGILFLRLAADAIDVNVHPTKQEIRFHKANVVHRFVVRTVRQAMQEFQQVLKKSIFGSAPDEKETGSAPLYKRSEEEPPTDYMTTVAEVSPKYTQSESSFMESGSARSESAAGSASAAERNLQKVEAGQCRKIARKNKDQQRSTSEPPGGMSRKAVLPDRTAGEERAGTAAKTVGGLRVIGQLFDTYILCQTEEEMVAIDQHAAQERLIYENLLQQYRNRKLSSQRLLFPRTVELGPDAIVTLSECTEEIERMGMVVEEFGGNTYVIKAVPALMADLDPEEILTGIVGQFADTENSAKMKGVGRMEQILATMACKAAIKAGRVLEDREIAYLLEQIRTSDVFSHCPHGRPVIKSFTRNEIEKWFSRT